MADTIQVNVERETLITVGVMGAQGPGGSGSGNLGDLGDVTLTSLASGDVLRYNGTAWVNVAQGSLAVAWASLTGVPSTFTPSAHNHAASEITSGTFADARIAQSNVTQHQASLSIAWGQLTSVPTTFAPSAHATSHRHGGADEIATATPAANAIPKANASGKLNSWVDATVSSVALSVPSFLSVTGTPVTTTGTLAISLATQTANTVFAGPTSGGVATPTFRALIIGDTSGLQAALDAKVAGPGSATDNAIVRFDGTTGKLVQNSAVTVADTTGDIVTPGFVAAGSTTAFAELVGGLLTNTYVAVKALGSATDVGLILQAKGSGAITVQQPDNTATGGNARGVSAIDLQLGRAAAASVASGAFSALLGGNDNSAQNGADVCIGGSSNTCAAGFGAVLGGSVAQCLAPYAVCIGGDSARASVDYALVIGGQGNEAGGYNAVVIGGLATSVTGDNGVGIGCDECTVGLGSTVIGARLSSASQAQGVIIGGKSCTNDGEQCVILGGLSNTINSGVLQCVVLAGQDNEIAAHNAVVAGNGAQARDESTIALGSGMRSSTKGTHQTVFATMSVETTNATPTDVYTNNNGTNFTVPSGKSITFHITGIARNTSNGDTKMFCLRQACMKNVSGTTSLVGSVQTSGTDQSDAGLSTASIAITADNTNDKLKIAVTGIAATNISWTFTVIATEVA